MVTAVAAVCLNPQPVWLQCPGDGGTLKSAHPVLCYSSHSLSCCHCCGLNLSGCSVQETVVLLGAHTLGGKGFGDATAFDNSYFSILLQRPWNDTSNKMAYMIGLPSDKAIVENDSAQK